MRNEVWLDCYLSSFRTDFLIEMTMKMALSSCEMCNRYGHSILFMWYALCRWTSRSDASITRSSERQLRCVCNAFSPSRLKMLFQYGICWGFNLVPEGRGEDLEASDNFLIWIIVFQPTVIRQMHCPCEHKRLDGHLWRRCSTQLPVRWPARPSAVRPTLLYGP